MPVTNARAILGPSLLNFDIRGDAYLTGLKETLPVERLYQVNGNTPGQPVFADQTQMVERASLRACTSGQMQLPALERLCFLYVGRGSPCGLLPEPTAPSCFDLQRCDWSEELLAWAYLDREKLPKPSLPGGSPAPLPA